MKVFVPLNKHLLIEKIKLKTKKESLVSLPEGYVKQTEGRYTTVRFIGCAVDCDNLYEDFFDSKGDIILAVDRSLIEEVIINDTKYFIIHQNHVVGVMEADYEINKFKRIDQK